MGRIAFEEIIDLGFLTSSLIALSVIMVRISIAVDVTRGATIDIDLSGDIFAMEGFWMCAMVFSCVIASIPLGSSSSIAIIPRRSSYAPIKTVPSSGVVSGLTRIPTSRMSCWLLRRQNLSTIT